MKVWTTKKTPCIVFITLEEKDSGTKVFPIFVIGDPFNSREYGTLFTPGVIYSGLFIGSLQNFTHKFDVYTARVNPALIVLRFYKSY